VQPDRRCRFRVLLAIGAATCISCFTTARALLYSAVSLPTFQRVRPVGFMASASSTRLAGWRPGEVSRAVSAVVGGWPFPPTCCPERRRRRRRSAGYQDCPVCVRLPVRLIIYLTLVLMSQDDGAGQLSRRSPTSPTSAMSARRAPVARAAQLHELRRPWLAFDLHDMRSLEMSELRRESLTCPSSWRP